MREGDREGRSSNQGIWERQKDTEGKCESLETQVRNGSGRGSKKEGGVVGIVGHPTGSVVTACSFFITGS